MERKNGSRQANLSDTAGALEETPVLQIIPIPGKARIYPIKKKEKDEIKQNHQQKSNETKITFKIKTNA